MLNITTRISLTKRSRKLIKKNKLSSNNILHVDSWKDISKSVKNEISKRLYYNQGYKCVYCERYLTGLLPQIDHFAHKSRYPQFSFTSINLFYACGNCNSSAIKGQKNTIYRLNVRYDNCIFEIVHPFLDDVDIHIIYQDYDKIFFDWFNCSVKGKNTIRFFDFYGLQMTDIRARTLIYERLNPYTTGEERTLIQSAISYK